MVVISLALRTYGAIGGHRTGDKEARSSVVLVGTAELIRLQDPNCTQCVFFVLTFCSAGAVQTSKH